MLLVFLVAAITKVEEDVDGGPPGVLSIFLVAATIKVEEDVNGGPPWGVLSVFLAVATTEVEEDVDGRPPGGCCQYFWQQPPPKLKKTSMATPLSRGAISIFGSMHHRS
jgi:hypothetical protein